MSKVLNAALDIMGFLNDEKDDPEIENEKSQAKIVLHPQKTVQPTIVHIIPGAFDDVTDIAQRLQKKAIVTINLAPVDVELSQRIFDFVSGVVYALNGGILQLAESVFLLAGQGVTLQERDSWNFRR